MGGPIWRKAPRVLVRFPGLLASILVGSLLVSLVAATYPLFLSRSEAGVLRAAIEDPAVGRFGAGLYYGIADVGVDAPAPGSDGRLLIETLDDAFERIAARDLHLGVPIRFIKGGEVSITGLDRQQPESGPVAGSVFFGTDAEHQVRVLSGDAEDGALLPDLIANRVDVRPGDTILLNGSRELRIGGVYASLHRQPRSGYWSPWSEQIFPQGCVGACEPPPPFILVDPREARRWGPASYGWMAPVADLPLDIDEARAIRDYADRTEERLSEREAPLGRLFRCCSEGIEFRSGMTSLFREVERRSAAAEGPLRPPFFAGLGAAAVVMAAAAAFAVAGRRTEAALLHARGWGPARFAVKAVVESVIPIAVGTVLGFGVAGALMIWLGSPAPVAASAQAAAIAAAAAAGAGSLALLALVTAVSFIRTFEVRTAVSLARPSKTHRLRRRLARVPWEFVAITGALYVLGRLRAGGALIEDPKLDISRPSLLLVVFPVLLVAGIATLLARALVALLGRAGRNLGRSSPASYLAVRRLTSMPRLTVLLMGATALCLGVFVNGQTMVRSLGATVGAKAGVFVGGDVQVLVEYQAPEQGSFPLPITRSNRLHWAGELLPSGRSFDIVGVDAETLPAAAFWDPAFADTTIEELAARLRSDAGPLPIVLVQSDDEPTAIRTAQAEIPVEVVGRADAFPGVSSVDPGVVVDLRSLERRVDVQGNPFHSANARTEYWIKGETQEALAAVSELKAYPLDTLTLEGVKDIPYIKAAIGTFSLMNLLGLAAALLIVGVLVVYLQARQRSRAVSGVLSHRMGMRAGQARLAIALELGSILLASFVVGAALGLVAAHLVVPLLDPLPMIRPDPLFQASASLLIWTAVGLVAATALGSWLVHRRASTVDLGEVLRVVD